MSQEFEWILENTYPESDGEIDLTSTEFQGWIGHILLQEVEDLSDE